MNFIIYFGITTFSKTLKAGSTAYIVPFALPGRTPTEGKGYVLITTDAGVEGGTIHALQIEISNIPEEGIGAIDFAIQASDMVAGFLKSRRMNVIRGVLSTAGLHESLQYWGQVARYSVTEVGKVLASIKKKALDERRRNQTNK